MIINLVLPKIRKINPFLLGFLEAKRNVFVQVFMYVDNYVLWEEEEYADLNTLRVSQVKLKPTWFFFGKRVK